MIVSTVARGVLTPRAKARRYCIRLTISPAAREDAWDLCRVALDYGDFEVHDCCFAFPNEERWLTALEVLRFRFGPEYWAVLQIKITVTVVRGNLQCRKASADFLAVPKPPDIGDRTGGNQNRHAGHNRQINPDIFFRHVNAPNHQRCLIATTKLLRPSQEKSNKLERVIEKISQKAITLRYVGWYLEHPRV